MRLAPTHTLLVALLSLWLTTLAWAGFDEGKAAYHRSDSVTALREFRSLAEQGDTGSRIYLGVMYARGHGVLQDYVRAHMWFNLAAVKGNESARNNRDTVAKNMTPAAIIEAQRLAREWLEQHGE